MSKKGGAAANPPPAKEAKAPAKEKEVKTPAPAAVDDKKAKAQPKQEPANESKTQEKGGNNNNNNNNRGGRGKQQQEVEVVPANTTASKQNQEPEDEVERGIMIRIGKLEDEMRVHKDEINKIRDRIEDKKQSQGVLKEEQGNLRQKSQAVGSMKEFNDQQAKLSKQRDDERAKLNAKVNEVKGLREQLKEARLVNAKDERISPDNKDYIKALEEKIKKLQEHQASGTINNIHEEKKLIAEIGKLSSFKKLYKTFSEVNEVIDKHKEQLKKIDTELDKVRTDKNELWSKKQEFEDQIKSSWDQHTSTSTEIDKEIARRKELNDIVTDLKKKVDALYDEKRDHRAAKREKAKKERDEEINKKKEERKLQELKRQKEEEEKGTYADELEAITQLVQYLEPFKYKAPEVATEEGGEKAEGEEGEKDETETPSTPPPSGDDARPKRGGKKKAVENSDPEKEIKHSAQIFFQFETVSLVAPTKVGEVEGAITQLNEKKDYLEKRSEDKKAKRKAANGTQDE